MKYIKELNSDILLEKLAVGPSEDDIANNNYINKNITLECLKMGDIFPTYHCVNNITLDVYYESESPCELITIKMGDLQDTIPVF
jgi:hypothetical protein